MAVCVGQWMVTSLFHWVYLASSGQPPITVPQHPSLSSAGPQVKQSVLPRIALRQNGLELLGSSCPPALVFHVAGITETHHYIWLLFFSGIYQLGPFRVS